MKYLKQHYHWLVAVLVFLEMIVFGGLINSASVFIVPMCEDFGVNRAAHALATTPYTFVCFMSTMLSGYIFQRFGYKKSALVALATVAFSLVVTAWSKNLIVFAISKVLFAMGYGVCFTAGSVRIVKQWFHKHQGLVLGAVSMSTGLGGSLMTIFLSSIIDSAGWRAANYGAAALVALIGVLYLLMKDYPQDMGLQPFGEGTQTATKKRDSRHDGSDWDGYPFREQLKRPAFYLMIFLVLLGCICIYMTSNVVVPHFQDRGFSATAAATYQSTLMLTLAVSKLIFGGLCDRIGPKPVAIMSLCGGIAGQLILSFTADPILSYAGVMLYSVSLAMTSMLVPLLAGPLFGAKACMSINGIFMAMCALANIFAAPLTNWVYDTTGSYAPGFLAAAAVTAVIICLYFLLFAITKKEKEKFLQQNQKSC